MSDEWLTVLGPDRIRRPVDEHYDSMKEVEADPFGAFKAIEAQAARIEELEAENARLKKLLVEGALDSLAAEGQAFDAYEEQKEPFSEYGHYGENNPPVGMSSPDNKGENK